MQAKRARRVWISAAALATMLGLTAPALGATEVIPGHQQRIQNNSHALGASLGYAGSKGIAYRYYFGNSFVQANALPWMNDGGKYLAAMMGLHVAHYMLVWNRVRGRGAGARLLPTTTALRVIGGATVDLERSEEDLGTHTKKTVCAAGGIGFEMGAILSPGLSVSLDVMLTSVWVDGEFQALVPLPYGGLMFSW